MSDENTAKTDVKRYASQIRLDVMDSFADAAHIAREVDRLCERLGGSIYMSYDWLNAWWAYYRGARRLLRLLLFWQENAPVAWLPFYVEEVGPSGLGLRVARLVGANVPPKCFDPPVAAEHALEILRLLMHRLIVHDKCHMISLGPVSRLWSGWEACEQWSEGSYGNKFTCWYRPTDVRVVFQLPRHFEEYVASLEPADRKRRLKRMRHLERVCRVQTDVVSDQNDVEREFEAFQELHACQWAREGRGGHFQAWPNALVFNRELVRRQARLGRVRFYRLLADGQVIASRYTFLFNNVLFSELPARRTGVPWDQLGIGICSLLYFIKEAIREGVGVIESGLGRYEHKASAGGTEIEAGLWRFCKRQLNHRLWIVLWLALGRGGLACYRKVWFRRILPYLPETFPRTQNLSWLAYDY